jgi:hypothetical protein
MNAVLKKTQLSEKQLSISKEIDTYADKLGAEILAVNWSAKAQYAIWMAQHYYLVKRTMRYICMAAGLSDPDDDKVYKYWMEHLKEEHHHHKFLEKDAQSIGVRLNEIDVFHSTRQLVDNIFEGMFFSKGIYLFGYAILLEGLSCKIGKDFTQAVTQAHGEKAASFLKLHTIVDDGSSGHYMHGKEFIEQLSLEDQKIVFDALKATYGFYSRIIARLNDRKALFHVVR